ncbi:MAG: hypothetical protein CMJ62_00185 [Planctomycetaceae bacterium]|nr:hypothetical protein [Planctomycetaceae bacterium]
MIGSNGRPIVLNAIRYKVDTAALTQYAASEEAVRVASSDETELRAGITERDLIGRFLQNVTRGANDEGTCTVSYTRCQIGQALVDAGLLTKARLYPERWPICATQLGRYLRSLALGKYYVEMDDENAFHKLLQARTCSERAKVLIERVISDKDLKPHLSQHYFGDQAHIPEVKKLLHALSNGGSVDTWREKHRIRADVAEHEFVIEFTDTMSHVTDELAHQGNGPAGVKLIGERFPTKLMRCADGSMRTVKRDPRLTWKSFVLQEAEVHGLMAKLETAEEFGRGTGPPLHDCLFIEKGRDLMAMAEAMSATILASTGTKVKIAVKELEVPQIAAQPVFKLDFNRSVFDEKDFRRNKGLNTDENIAVSLEEYDRWLRRFFVAVVKEKDPIIAELAFIPGTDRISKIICRSPERTMRNYLKMDIQIGKNKNTGLLAWYLELNPERRTADQLQMWTSPEDAAAHPRDLNIFGGLRFDERHFQEGGAKIPFLDPFPARPPIFNKYEGWKETGGLQFVLWHIKHVLCNSDAGAFAYLMQWFGYILQTRLKPGVLVCFYGAPGIGKSALVGKNGSGPGILARIYSTYYQKVSKIEQVLKDFNVGSMNKLFCCLEEATPYRKAQRNNDQLNDFITEGTIQVEPKGIDAFEVNDYRAFVCCTNNADAFRITDGDRRFFMLEASDKYSQKAVDEKRCTSQERKEYMSKLDAVKNDEEVAYAFFKYAMLLDLAGYNVHEPYQTELHSEQKGHNECALKCFLIAVKSGEYRCSPFADGYFSSTTGKPNTFTSLQLMTHFRDFIKQSGLHTNIESIKSLGWALKKYSAYVQKLDGRAAQYVLQVDEGCNA